MNRLVHESSPYLRQHAHNPVDWYPWGEDALRKAREEDKPILVSIGYSACHWCHVMERESFEQESVARLMNEHFVCIKVDREERPDVDAIYMDAVQAMGIRGGWPLNVFLMPDAKPFYGGTYFPARNWMSICQQIGEAFQTQRQALQDSAEGFTRNMHYSETEKYGLPVPTGLPVDFTPEELKTTYTKLAASFDVERGGTNGAPKFPMPVIWLFALRYFQQTYEPDTIRAVRHTLDRMALGGIYDQIGGGFARYSTDGEWFLPHFEKMLYDNAQLLSLYSEAWLATKEPLYKRVVYQTVEWLQREMTHPEGGFYSALDADSEGEEGKFYTWTKTEILEILGPVWGELVCDYFQVTEEGNYHEESSGHATGKNILFPQRTLESFEQEHELISGQMDGLFEKLRQVRDSRIHPGLDDKILTSWNGLMLKGLVDAYRTFGEGEFLALALQNAQFIKDRLLEDGQLFHSYKEGQVRIPGFLEDYAAVADAFTHLYQATFDESWLRLAEQLADYAISHFWDEADGLFFFTDRTVSDALIARKKELFDNVIPSSNSIMATALYTLSLLLDRPDFGERSHQMLQKVKGLLASNPEFLPHWASLASYHSSPTVEIAIVGPLVQEYRRQLESRYLPNKVLTGAEESGTLPLLLHRDSTEGRTMVYVCYNRACQLPVDSVAAAWELVG
ncbi:thioredoxin domain-containing protein [Siphonobacter sp.]|uniref:thioredoxin domain-containing protein n=1 Tax=Siphonobacter sp. TaxID=1869184 RepID=UPI003B3B5B3F